MSSKHFSTTPNYPRSGAKHASNKFSLEMIKNAMKGHCDVSATKEKDEDDINIQWFYILLDVSGSMDDYDSLGAAKEAVEKIFEFLQNDAERKHDRFSLLAFSSDVRKVIDAKRVCDLTLENVTEQLDELCASGGTAIWDAVYFCLPTTERNKMRKMIIHCITDGQDTQSTFCDKERLTAVASRLPNLSLNFINIGPQENTSEYACMASGKGGAYHSQTANLVQDSLQQFSQLLD